MTSAQRTDGPSAAAQIADARCRHADICREIGPNRPYASRAACVRDAEQRAGVDLHAADCPQEVDTIRLEACLTKITLGSCSDTNAQFETDLACSSGQLCP